MKVCPQCKYQFGDEHQVCPTHRIPLTAMTIYLAPGQANPGAATIFYNPHAQQPQENYDRLIGTVLDGRYMLMQKMGEGGMGVVFKARHTVIEKTVAVKILKRDVARDRAVLQRFVQEAKAASRIGHGSIVDVTDFGTLPDGSAYQVMEFIDGVTLSRAIKDGPMWAARAMPIIGQIAMALGAAHEKGIVHRDLKPDNIFLVEKNGRHDMVKIVDFGVAKFAPLGNMEGPRLTRAGAVFGTPEYMAPEQAAGRSDSDHRVDVYALGTILYEMVVGRVPHKGETIVATLAQQMLDPIIPPRRMNPRADVSDRLEQVIMTAVAKDRDRRYQTMADFWIGLEWAAVELGVVLDVGGTMSVDMPMPSIATGGPPGFDVSRSMPKRQLRTGPTTPDIRESVMLQAEAAAAGGRARGRSLTFAALGVIGIAALTVGVAFALKTRHPGPGSTDNEIIVVRVDAGGGGALAGAEPDAAVAGEAVDAMVFAHLGIDAGTGSPTEGLEGEGTPGEGEGTAGDGEGTPEGERTGPSGLTGELVAARDDPRIRDGTEANAVILGHGPDHDIVVTTTPAGGSLYVGGLAAGTDGTTFKRPRGTRMEVRCIFPGNDRWEPGKLSLVFDGRTTRTECRLTRRTRCVKDLHNPFRECPD